MTASQWLTGFGAALTVIAPMIAPLNPTAGIILGAIAAGLTAFNQSLRYPTRKGSIANAKKQIVDEQHQAAVEKHDEAVERREEKKNG